MTVISIPPDEAQADAVARHEFMTGLLDLEEWAERNPGAELPDGRTFSKRVCGGTYEDKVTELHRIARSWGVSVEPPMKDGTLIARRVFEGGVTLAAVVSPPDATYADFQNRISQRPEAAA